MDICGTAAFPGVIAVRSCSYTHSHGISPGTATLVCVEQPNPPAEIGDLLISDGPNTVKILGCRVDNIKTTVGGGNERLWIISLKDRRWKWVDYGTIFGCYNQLDPNGKLIPWTVRSPVELAVLCLQRMGEIKYVLNLPAGLPRQIGLTAVEYLHNGELFPQTGLNPCINWYNEKPANALQQVAELFGCRVVYDVLNDQVIVTPIGIGAGLPDGHIKQYGPSVTKIAVPDGIQVVGDKTKYQMRLLLEPVGEEWNGEYKPLEQLSYAPTLPNGNAQKTLVRIRSASSPLVGSGQWTITINNVDFAYTSSATDALSTVSAALLAAINAGAFGVTAAFGDTVNDLVLTGRPTIAFDVNTSVVGLVQSDPDLAVISSIMTQPSTPDGGRGFDYCDPPYFTDVVATNRLTYDHAQRLARNSVFKYYRVRNIGSNGAGPIHVPGYGPIPRRQQLELTNTRVEQIKPELPSTIYERRNPNLDPGAFGDGTGSEYIVNFYNGYSREMPAVVYGSFAENQSQYLYQHLDDGNTSGDQLVLIEFDVDPIWQIVKFKECVYRYVDHRIYAGRLTLETGVFLRESETNQYTTYTLSQQLNAVSEVRYYESQRHEDVSLGIIGKYNFTSAGTPLPGGRKKKATLRFAATQDPTPGTAEWSVTIGLDEYSYSSLVGDTAGDVCAAFLAMIPNGPSVTVSLVAGTANTLEFVGVDNGYDFAIQAEAAYDDTSAGYGFLITQIKITQTAKADQQDYVSQLVSVSVLEADPLFRAQHYLKGMLLKYQIKQSQIVEYNTIVPISCNGAIAQVTWEIGDGRPVHTVASVNCEHSDWVPPYPVRRRAELLAPAESNGLQNVINGGRDQ